MRKKIGGAFKLPGKVVEVGAPRVIEPLEARRLLSVNVFTAHNDLGRTGLNAAEVSLTPSNVNGSTFGKLFSYPVQGQVYAQPLYVSNLNIPGKGTHNVILVATENNDVYALDADSNAGASAGVLWHVNLGLAAATPNSFFGNRYGPYHDINPQVGITSTPVIDPATNTIYLDAFTQDVPGQNACSHHIHALDLTTGADKVTPMLVSASVKGAGVGGDGTTIPFVATQELQRPALTLLNGVLYVAYSGYADTDPYHGWILGFNSSTLALTKVLNTTPGVSTDNNEGEGGIWQTGAGLASDGSDLFMIVGNGDYDPSVGNYSDSFLRVTPDTSTPAAPHLTGYGLNVTDYFTPFNEQSLADADADLGSAGLMLIPDQAGPFPHKIVGAGKQGVIYLINRDSGQMGGHTTTTDNVLQKISQGHGDFNSPAYFNSAIYYHAVGDVLKRYTLSSTTGLLSSAPASQSAITYGGQGATPSISSNGTANGIAWDVQFDGTHQVLHAYDATSLTELYNSSQNAARDQMGTGVKFIVPTVADGHVIVGASGVVTVYGLLTPPITAPAAPSDLAAVAPGPSTVNLTWVDHSNNESGFKIERSTNNVQFTQIGVASADATTYADTTVTASTQYYYRIRATNVIGDSAYTTPSASVVTPSATGAIYLYHFDAGTGTSAVDSSSGNNGTLTGSPLPQWVNPGKIGARAMSFSGDGTYNRAALQSAVKVTTNLAPILGSTSTLDVWVKTTQVGSATHWRAPAITGVEEAGVGNDINWGTLDATGRIGIYVGDFGGLYSTNPVNDGQWHNVAMTRNATSGVVQLYVDGTLQGSATFEAGNKTSQFTTIGALTDVSSDGVTRTGNNYFNGQLDEVRIYNQVLGANEISGLSIIPSPPTITAATAMSGPVVHLTWTTPSSFTQNIEVDRKVGVNGTYAAVATLGGGVTVYDDTNVTPGVQYFYNVKAIDLAGTSAASNAVSVTPPAPTVVARSILYNESAFDGQNGSSNQTDTVAVATDKVALLPGQTANFQNISNYSKGINGIIIDVANLDNLPRFEDYSFTVGNTSNPATWTQAPVPTYINVYPGRGPNGSTQITIIWDNNVIQNEWLRVSLLANAHTNLLADDTFYFGNAIGETGDGLSPSGPVDSSDYYSVRDHLRSYDNLAPITWNWDFDRDRVTDLSDIMIARQSAGVKLVALTAPSPVTVAGGTTSSATAPAPPLRSSSSTTVTTTTPPRATPVRLIRSLLPSLSSWMQR